MKPVRLVFPWLFVLLAPACLPGQDVGSGPFSATIRNEFVRSYFRNNFHILTSLPPSGDIKKLGATGLVQEFPDAAKTAGVKYALVRATLTDSVVAETDSVLHVYPNTYSYAYSSMNALGANTIGYPNMDTRPCPVVMNLPSCEWQTFDKKYVLFAYSQSTLGGQNFNVKDPFYTKWVALGGIGGLGPATGAEESAVSTVVTGSTAALQRFAGGALYNITAGNFNGRLFTVREPIHTLYQFNNGYLGFLGLPISDEIAQVNGRIRQNFEGGAIEYEPGQTPVLRLPVAGVNISSSIATDRLNLGDTAVLSATTFAANGGLLEGRTITWVSSNSRVVTVDPSGTIVNIRAVGGGSANITGISEGKASRAITFFVTAPCCQIGEGAPTPAAQQAFRDAATRNRLNVKLPAASPVRRAGNGFVQELISAEDPLVRYLVTKLDTVAVAYVVTGPILERYNELTGPAGALGFPLGDPAVGPRQLFQGGALAGNPVFLVVDPILTRWGLQNYERGAAGLPAGAAQSVLSFAATLGVRQSFGSGLMAGHLSGTFLSKAFLVSGAILAKYSELGATSGAFGLPVGDESLANGRRRQEFEGGFFEVPPGAVEAIATERDRKPQISATPATVPAGGRLRVAVGGFNTGATLRISVGGQPDFLVKTETGAFAWDLLVAANAPTGLVTLRAVDTARNAIAVGSYLVQSASSTLAQVTKIRGDLQTGYPGARLRQALRILVRDEFGNVLAGVPVRFTASPGAQVEGASTLTDAAGQAEAYLRLPLQELPALATAEAGRQVVTFSARTVSGSFTGFPRFVQGTSPETRDGLINAAAATLRYLQDTGQVPAANGAAEPALLYRFLKAFCVFDVRGEKICDGFLVAPGGSAAVMNPWRLPAFAGGNLDIAPAGSKTDEIRDLLGQGIPVLLGLTLATGGTTGGSHFVVANGVAPNGAILIHDPSPVFNRTTLDEYLAGFTVSGAAYRGSLSAAAQLVPRSPSPVGFLVVTAEAVAQVSSAAGSCGFALSWPEAQVQPGSGAASGPGIRMHYCDGILPAYQLDLGGAGRQSFTLTDLGSSGGRSETTATVPAAFRLTRPVSSWTASLQQLSFEAGSVRNGADFSTQLSPGVLAAIFGQGLAAPGQRTAVEIGGRPATVMSESSFQVNIAAPLDLPPGDHLVRISSAYGQGEQIVNFQAVSPALFRQLGMQGIVLNQDGTLNSPTNPARRGQVIVVYATGLGAVARQGALDVVQTRVEGLLEGNPLETLYAGLAPGFPGVYQLNLRIGADLPPGLQQGLTIRQGGIDAGPVFVAVQ